MLSSNGRHSSGSTSGGAAVVDGGCRARRRAVVRVRGRRGVGRVRGRRLGRWRRADGAGRRRRPARSPPRRRRSRPSPARRRSTATASHVPLAMPGMVRGRPRSWASPPTAHADAGGRPIASPHAHGPAHLGATGRQRRPRGQGHDGHAAADLDLRPPVPGHDRPVPDRHPGRRAAGAGPAARRAGDPRHGDPVGRQGDDHVARRGGRRAPPSATPACRSCSGGAARASARG